MNQSFSSYFFMCWPFLLHGYLYITKSQFLHIKNLIKFLLKMDLLLEITCYHSKCRKDHLRC